MSILMLVALIVLVAILYQVQIQTQTQTQTQTPVQAGGAVCPFGKVYLTKNKDNNSLTLTVYQVGSDEPEPARTFKNYADLAKFWKFLKLNNPGLSSCPYDYSNISDLDQNTEEDDISINSDSDPELEDRIDRNKNELERLESSFQELENRLSISVSSSAEISADLKDITRPPSKTTMGYSRKHGQNPQEPCPVAYDTHSYFFLRA